jgi:proteic killer suppression protein
MIEKESDIVHKALRNFWVSGGKSTVGLNADFIKVLRNLLVHLDSARSLQDIKGGYGRLKDFKPLTGHDRRYELEVNGNWRLTFDCHNPDTGAVTIIDLEDVHRRGGAKVRH